MGLQLIFVVESNISCKSDWIYIKDTIDYFYNYEKTKVKLQPVYLGGKGNYIRKERKILSHESAYASTSKENKSKVIYCFDCDEYDVNHDDSEFLSNIQDYCNKKGRDFVWFCKDIENVYLGKR